MFTFYRFYFDGLTAQIRKSKQKEYVHKHGAVFVGPSRDLSFITVPSEHSVRIMKFHLDTGGLLPIDATRRLISLRIQSRTTLARHAERPVADLRRDAAGEKAAAKVAMVLKRLSSSTYEVAVKMITDIGSATVKKMLGL